MIRVTLDLLPELKGNGSFNIRSKPQAKHRMKNNNVGTIIQNYEQRCGAGAIHSMLQALEVFVCDAQITVEVANGKATVNGEIRARTYEAYQGAQYVVGRFQSAVQRFAPTYPKSSCTLTYEQTMQIKSVTRAS
jgi:hypothetical protein